MTRPPFGKSIFCPLESGGMVLQNLEMTGSMEDLNLKSGFMTTGEARVNENLMPDLVVCANLVDAKTWLCTLMGASREFKFPGPVCQLEGVASWEKSRRHDNSLP